MLPYKDRLFQRGMLAAGRRMAPRRPGRNYRLAIVLMPGGFVPVPLPLWLKERPGRRHTRKRHARYRRGKTGVRPRMRGTR